MFRRLVDEGWGASRLGLKVSVFLHRRRSRKEHGLEGCGRDWLHWRGRGIRCGFRWRRHGTARRKQDIIGMLEKVMEKSIPPQDDALVFSHLRGIRMQLPFKKLAQWIAWHLDKTFIEAKSASNCILQKRQPFFIIREST